MKTMKKAQAGTSMPKKPVSKPAVKKSTAPAPKKRTYSIIPDEVTNEGYLNLGPREKTPGGGFSKYGSKLKKSMKMGGTMKKAQLGMKSVTAGQDNNKGVTRADFVAIGKGEAKKGTKMKKAMMGTDMMQSPMMKKGGAMKKCKYGCK
jgi:hypothetical protein